MSSNLDTLLGRENDRGAYRFIPIESPRHIRTLHLQPAASLTAPLCCTISSVCLDDGFDEDVGIDYTALSYSWDAQRPSRPINLDGRTLCVTPNCEAAMRRLRNPTEEAILWIDSICIDQSPEAVEEQSQQVGLMGDVYQRAKRVIVWLGESDAATDRAMKTIVDIVGESRADYMSRSSRVLKFNTSFGQLTGDPLAPVLQRSWFGRIWTVQEATLAIPDRVQVQCGSTSIPWQSLAALAYVFERHPYRWGTWRKALWLQARLTVFLFLSRRPEAWERLHDSEKQKNAIHAYKILFHTKDKKATKPEDKVFALYGLFKELSFEIPEPDYQKPIEMIYREATVASIKHDRLLKILYYVPSDNRRPGMSSWVPDWNDPAWAVEDSRSPVVGGEFQASRRSNPFWEFSDDETKLIVMGKIFDEVIYRSAVMPSLQKWSEEGRDAGIERLHGHQLSGYLEEYSDSRSQAIDVFKTWLDVSEWSDYPTGEPTKEAFRRAITMDGAKKTDDPSQGAVDRVRQLNQGLDALRTLSSQSFRPGIVPLLNTLNDITDLGQAAIDKVRHIDQSLDASQTPHSKSDGSEYTQFLDTLKQGSSAFEAVLAGSRDFDQWLNILQAPESQISALATAATLPGLPPQWQEDACRIMARQPLGQQTNLAFGKLGDYNRYLIQMNRNKCFFRTANGYFGTAPDPPCVSVQAGDMVAMISGLDQPVLLRPVKGGWRYLTHIYLHGIMSGEAWPGDSSELERLSLI